LHIRAVTRQRRPSVSNKFRGLRSSLRFVVAVMEVGELCDHVADRTLSDCRNHGMNHAPLVDGIIRKNSLLRKVGFTLKREGPLCFLVRVMGHKTAATVELMMDKARELLHFFGG